MDFIANIAKAVVTGAATNIGATDMVKPVISLGQCLFFPNKVITDLENEKKELTSERDSMLVRVQQAKERTEVIEEPVDKWLKDVENLLKEVEDLEQRMTTYNNCFHGLCPTCKRYCLCRQMAEKTEVLRQFKAKSNIQPFSHVAPLPGIQYLSSENFTFFESTKVAYSQLLEALCNDGIYMIGVCGTGGSGKTTLVTEVGKKAEQLNLFDKVILVTVSQSPSILNIQEKMAAMLSLELKEKNEEDRAQRLWLCLKEKKRILIIVDDLWRKFELKDIGIRFDNDLKGRWKVLLTTRRQGVCTSMDCQKSIYLDLLSKDESWTLFQKHANIDDAFSKSLNDVPWELCDECNGLPLVVVAMGSSLKGKSNAEWEASLLSLRHSEAVDDHIQEEVRKAFTCLKLSYDYLENKEAKLLFLMCSMFPEDFEIDIEALIRYAIGLGLGGRFSLDSARSWIRSGINKLLDSCLLMHVESWENHVKMHDMVRDVALWIAKASENHKIMVNIDKPLSTLAEDYCVRDYFALCTWYHENQISLQLNASNLKILLLHFGRQPSFNLSHATFEEMKGLKVFSLINDITYGASLTLPQSTQLLTNLQTLRLNGWELGDISFIASLTRLEVLDLRFCRLNELPNKIEELKRLKLLDLSRCRIDEEIYNGAIGKCSQLEELYLAACCDKYIGQSVEDIFTLPKLQRFVIHTESFKNCPRNFISEGKTRVLELVDFDISNLKASERKLLQKAETVCLRSLHGGCKNISPDMIRGKNDWNSLRLVDCAEVECIFDTTSDSDDALIPSLVKLELRRLENLKELCRGPPLQVLCFFEKLQELHISDCPLLHSIFPWQCNLGNLKILIIRECSSIEVLFSMSVAQSLQQLEELTVEHCDELKHIIAGGREDGSSTSREVVPALAMPCLKKVHIIYCEKLESIFPICCVEGLARLQEIEIYGVGKLKYVFGECDHEDHSSHQYDNHIMLPHLDVLELSRLENLIGICLENYCANWPPSRKLNVWYCPKLRTSWIAVMAGSVQRQQHMNEEIIHLPSKLQQFWLSGLPQLNLISWVGPTPGLILRLQCLRELRLHYCENLKSLFSMAAHRILPELELLDIYNCQELEQIIEENEEELEQHLSNAEVFFPKLTYIEIDRCNKLKSLFSVAMVRMLPQLSILKIVKATQLEEVFRHGSEDSTINEMEIVLPNLTEVELKELPIFVDICQGFKLQAVKLQSLNIDECLKTAPSLRAIQYFNYGSYDKMEALPRQNIPHVDILLSLAALGVKPKIEELLRVGAKDADELTTLDRENDDIEDFILNFPVKRT